MARPRRTLLKELKQELPHSARLLLAVSGGIDSIALLRGAVALKESHNLTLEVAHVDHRLREDSHLDAKFVEQQALSLNLPFHLKECLPRKAGENLEAWGRKQRYDFFRDLLSNRELDLIVTAHTADDVAETLLMKLFSNKEVNSIQRRDDRRNLIRPMLMVARVEVESFVADNSLEYREDSSNSDPSFLRNRVRHNIIPILRRDFDPRISETLSERARAFEEDIECLYAECLPALNRLGGYEMGSREWLRAAREELIKLPPAVQWRLGERLFLNKLGFNLGRNKSKELVSLLLGEIIGVELPGGIQLRAAQGGISIPD